MAATTHLWLALDPETGRVLAQDRDWSETDFPGGAHGRGWPRREVDVPTGTFTKVCRASMSPAAVDAAHLRWWEEAAP
jgi:hypothetical protein